MSILRVAHWRQSNHRFCGYLQPSSSSGGTNRRDKEYSRQAAAGPRTNKAGGSQASPTEYAQQSEQVIPAESEQSQNNFKEHDSITLDRGYSLRLFNPLN